METTKRFMLTGLLIVAALAASACTIHIDRSPDGSLRAETEMPEAFIQKEIALAIADPQFNEVTTDLRDGYVVVTGEKRFPIGDHVDTLTFELRLGVADGHLTATVSEAKLNENPIDQAKVAEWNEKIAQNLEKGAKKNPDSSLEAVVVTEDALTMVWRIETRRSKGQ